MGKESALLRIKVLENMKFKISLQKPMRQRHKEHAAVCLLNRRISETLSVEGQQFAQDINQIFFTFPAELFFSD